MELFEAVIFKTNIMKVTLNFLGVLLSPVFLRITIITKTLNAIHVHLSSMQKNPV